MSFSAKKLLQQYGSAGVIAYGGVTMVSIGSIYLGLKSGVDILVPLEKCLGSDSEMFRSVKSKLGDVSEESGKGLVHNGKASINWAREGAYIGIAGALDSFVLPLKLMACVPLARYILKVRGKRRP